MKTTTTLLLVLAAAAITSVAGAQDLTLKGRSAVGLNIGLWGGAKASNTITITGIQSKVSADQSAFAGGLFYEYWLEEQVSLTLGVSMLAAEASSTVGISGITQQTSSVVPLLLGLRFYLPNPEPGAKVRPFLAGAVGGYVGSEAKNTLLAQEARTETVIGGRVGAGIDFFVGNHVNLGVNAGYNLMADFATPIGGRKNYNGADFALGFAYVF